MKLIAITALLSLSSTAADADRLGEYGGWTLYENVDEESPSCSIQGRFGKAGEFVHVFYDAKANDIYFSFEERDATSIKEGDKRQLGIYFLKGSRLDDGWGEKEFEASVDKDDGVRSFATNLEAGDFLKDFAESSSLGLTYKGKVFTAFNLSGTAIAVAKLKACAFRVAGLNPNDPFLGG